MVSLTRESTARPELGIRACGPCNRREPSASQNQGSEAASEDVSFIFNLVVDFAVGVYVRDTLLYTPFGLSRDYIRKAGHIVARRFRVCRQLFEHLDIEF